MRSRSRFSPRLSRPNPSGSRGSNARRQGFPSWRWSSSAAGRSIDYAETRADLDATRVAYYDLRWGGGLGSIMPAVERRIKANVLYIAGLGFQRALPEVDEINYIGRVRQPTLILNGELDFFFPAETSQRPMFELLGTPAADKKRLVFPGGHSAPRTEMIKESLDWLDRYLGPVNWGPGPGAACRSNPAFHAMAVLNDD